MDYDIAIVGGGAAGLIAARTLGRAGRSVVLLEARERLGGRMLTQREPRALAPVELGPEFVHGNPAVTARLLAEFGATVVDNGDAAFSLVGGRLEAEREDRFAAARELLRGALEREDETVDALLARFARDPALAPTIFDTWRLIAGFDAADPACASARAIAKEWTGDASAGGTQSRPLCGYGALVDHLARTLDPKRVRVNERAIVTRIERGPRGIRTTFQRDGRTRTLRTRRAIVTVPIGVLRASAGARGAIVFDPPLPPATRAAIDAIVMGPVVKVVLVFRSAFWETLEAGRFRDGAFFDVEGDFAVYWTQVPVRANTLVAWAGGPLAEHLAGLDRETLVQRALEGAGRLFGDAARAEREFVAAHLHDWQSDPFSRGAYSYVLAGGDGARETLAQSVDGCLWFAGEAAAGDPEGGTVAGALQSGEAAATSVARSLR